LSKILVLDSETTSIGKEDVVIELGYISLPESLGWLKDTYINFSKPIEFLSYLTNIYEERFFPPVPINRRATEIHGIQFKDLFGKRKSSEVTIPEDTDYLLCHNGQFDIRMLKQSNDKLIPLLDKVKLIDTMVLAKTLKKNVKLTYENVQLDTLVKFYYPADWEKLIQKNHAALSDCKKTVLVLVKLLENLPHIKTWSDLYDFQQSLKAPIKVKKEKV
jgi:exodeoxyribonuclease X